jgi:hypothetical protein
MLQSLLRRTLRYAFETEFTEQDAYYGRQLGSVKRERDLAKVRANTYRDRYEELADAYDELLTAKGRDGA